jgi:hypothetical protein
VHVVCGGGLPAFWRFARVDGGPCAAGAFTSYPTALPGWRSVFRFTQGTFSSVSVHGPFARPFIGPLGESR